MSVLQEIYDEVKEYHISVANFREEISAVSKKQHIFDWINI